MQLSFSFHFPHLCPSLHSFLLSLDSFFPSRTHTHKHTHPHTHTRIHKHTRIHTHTQTNTHTNTHTHAHTNTHKHTNTLLPSPPAPPSLLIFDVISGHTSYQVPCEDAARDLLTRWRRDGQSARPGCLSRGKEGQDHMEAPQVSGIQDKRRGGGSVCALALRACLQEHTCQIA